MKYTIIKYKSAGHRADIGPFKITRLVSNRYAQHVGHFVFLDHIQPAVISERKLTPEAAHPHRGIATLTYILEGAVEHFDSKGHKGMVDSGGVQWMKAGNGIIHNEAVGPDKNKSSNKLHGFQFWINLPGEEKKKDPEYLAVQANDLPVVQLDEDAGTLKVVVGEYAGKTSAIPVYASQNLYHIRLNGRKSFNYKTSEGFEYAAFLPLDAININNEKIEPGTLVGFSSEGGSIAFSNPTESETEFILFGGEPYREPFVAYGPFVMNTMEEIQEAYADYRSGKYGEMIYR